MKHVRDLVGLAADSDAVESLVEGADGVAEDPVLAVGPGRSAAIARRLGEAAIPPSWSGRAARCVCAHTGTPAPGRKHRMPTCALCRVPHETGQCEDTQAAGTAGPERATASTIPTREHRHGRCRARRALWKPREGHRDEHRINWVRPPAVRDGVFESTLVDSVERSGTVPCLHGGSGGLVCERCQGVDD